MAWPLTDYHSKCAHSHIINIFHFSFIIRCVFARKRIPSRDMHSCVGAPVKWEPKQTLTPNCKMKCNPKTYISFDVFSLVLRILHSKSTSVVFIHVFECEPINSSASNGVRKCCLVYRERHTTRIIKCFFFFLLRHGSK